MKCIKLTKDIYKVSHYLAMEEYFLEIKEECFFIWNIHPSVVIGKNQIVQTEINIDYAKEKNIHIFRRHSGGGAIYADDGCFMYSFIVKKDTINNLYKTYLNKICEALHELNINAYIGGRNDLLLDDQKISGAAILIKGDYAVVHGTMLYKSNFDEMAKILTPSKLKLDSHGVKSVKSRVTNLCDLLYFSKYEFMKYLEEKIANGDEIVDLNNEEEKIINKKEEIYLNSNYLNTKIPYEYKQSKRFTSGIITIHFKIIDNIINNITISGDFFENEDIEKLYKFFINKPFKKDIILSIIDNIDISKYIYGINNQDFKELFLEMEG